MPYHRNKAMLQYTVSLLLNILPSDVEVIIVGNNDNVSELDVELPARIKYIKRNQSMLYSKTVNLGVMEASGDIITLCDQDIFSYDDWYTPLLNKLLSSPQIGTVSSKLLNPANERIIDFGIEYSQYRIVHSYRGHYANYPPTLVDRKVSSTTSAILMLRKELYNKVNGMDPDMPYCCSDCDISLKISELGYENWVVARSIAYHKGSSSPNNGKSQSFSHLMRDSHCMFWAKNYSRLTPTIDRELARSVSYFSSVYKFRQLYIFINLSTVYEYKWYAQQLTALTKCNIAEFYSYKVNQNHYSSPIQIYDIVSYSFMNMTVPIIYFVDYFPALKENAIWCRMRNTSDDIVMDIHGNIMKLTDIVAGNI